MKIKIMRKAFGKKSFKVIRFTRGDDSRLTVINLLGVGILIYTKESRNDVQEV